MFSHLKNVSRGTIMFCAVFTGFKLWDAGP
jgi:hypothetical protein